MHSSISQVNQKQKEPNNAYTYNQWLEKSMAVFKSEIEEITHHHFDALDHKLAVEKNQRISKSLDHLKEAWILKKKKLFDIVTLIIHDIVSIKSLRPSTFELVSRVKNCLDDIKNIDLALAKDTDSQSIWFYSLIEHNQVASELDRIIKKLEKQLNNYQQETKFARIKTSETPVESNEETKAKSLSPS